MPSSPSYCLIADLGTSAAKAGLFSLPLTRVPLIERLPYAHVAAAAAGNPDAAAAPRAAAVEAAFAALARRLKGAADALGGRIEAVLIGSAAPALIACDAAGRPLTDLLFPADAKAAAAPAAPAAEAPAAPAAEAGRAKDTGAGAAQPEEASFRGRPSYYAPLFRLAAERLSDEAFSRLHACFSPAEYLTFRLCGTAAAFSPSPRLDPFFWEANRPEMRPFRHALPPFARWGTPMGAVTRAGAAFSGLPVGVPVLAGAPDYALALLGAGAVEAGVACDRTGTGEGINFVTAETDPLPPELAALHPALLPHPLEGLINASFVFEPGWTRETLPRFRRRWQEWGAISRRYGFRWVATGARSTDPVLGQRKSAWLGLPLEVLSIPEAELTGGFCAVSCSLGLFPNLREAVSTTLNLLKHFDRQG